MERPRATVKTVIVIVIVYMVDIITDAEIAEQVSVFIINIRNHVRIAEHAYVFIINIRINVRIAVLDYVFMENGGLLVLLVTDVNTGKTSTYVSNATQISYVNMVIINTNVKNAVLDCARMEIQSISVEIAELVIVYTTETHNAVRTVELVIAFIINK